MSYDGAHNIKIQQFRNQKKNLDSLKKKKSLYFFTGKKITQKLNWVHVVRGSVVVAAEF